MSRGLRKNNSLLLKSPPTQEGGERESPASIFFSISILLLFLIYHLPQVSLNSYSSWSYSPNKKSYVHVILNVQRIQLSQTNFRTETRNLKPKSYIVNVVHALILNRSTHGVVVVHIWYLIKTIKYSCVRKNTFHHRARKREKKTSFNNRKAIRIEYYNKYLRACINIGR